MKPIHYTLIDGTEMKRTPRVYGKRPSWVTACVVAAFITAAAAAIICILWPVAP